MDKSASRSRYQEPNPGPHGGVVTAVYDVEKGIVTSTGIHVDHDSVEVELTALQEKLAWAFRGSDALRTDRDDIAKCSVTCAVNRVDSTHRDMIVGDVRTVLVNLLAGSAKVNYNSAIQGAYEIEGRAHHHKKKKVS